MGIMLPAKANWDRRENNFISSSSHAVQLLHKGERTVNLLDSTMVAQ